MPYHLFFVAIPEEFFYRGYVQTRLNEVFPRKFLIFGTPVGWALPIACLFFAFGHSLVMVRWWHFATFFPGLVFGWLRERTGHPLAGALFHAWANVTVTWLDTRPGGLAPGPHAGAARHDDPPSDITELRVISPPKWRSSAGGRAGFAGRSSSGFAALRRPQSGPTAAPKRAAPPADLALRR